MGELSVEEVPAALQALRGRAAQAMSNYRIRVAKAAIEEYLGGPIGPKDVKGKNGNIVIEKGNRKFRMDFEKLGEVTGSDGRKIPEKPHFHLEELRDGEWEDSTNVHRYYYRQY